ncbi:lipoprotein, partial [Paenibacillus sp. GCM10027629]|uniref:LptM family lipoprotein n=1 Tax=Paenibacillus sp. GCM10027629 TaxID=3273414 RepID=UPI0036399CFB
MKRINLWMISVITLFAISGCQGQKTSFKADTFSDKDKYIVSIQNSKALCYGDLRANIESIIQDGGDSGHPFVMYHSGV